MNERIKELAHESGLPTYNPDGIPTKLEKFAELIVRECLSIIDDAERGGSNEIWDNAVKFIRKDLKEHFGIEQ